MSDWRKFDCLLVGEIPRSIINEVDFVVDHAVKVESALEIARQRWRCAELISGEDHERE